MDHVEREHLKKKIEADLSLLIQRSWRARVIKELELALQMLENSYLEGYDN